MKALANSWAFSTRIGPLIGILLPRIDVNHFSKASFNFSYIQVFTLCRFSDEFWKASKIFSLLFFQVARVLTGILNWLATPLLGLPFSSSFNASYFTFKVTSWCFLFVVIVIASATQQSNSIKFKDFKTFEYCGIRIEKFELTTVEYRRMEKLDSETKIRITWGKIRPGDPKICSI